MEITLQEMCIENFKGCRYFEFRPMGRSCVIRGRNDAGKTTVYDAFVWCLFGKDSKGRKDFDLKPLDANGEVLNHSAITSVEILLKVDDEDLILRRTYAEKWTSRRGKSEAEFDGHESEYFIDDVPVKKNAFDDKVNTTVDETTFRMLTNLIYFTQTMKWQDRRATLFDLAGIEDDETIMLHDQKFGPLRDALNGKTVEDFKKVLVANRKRLASGRSDIPARIDEQQKTVRDLRQVDFENLRKQRQEMIDREEDYRTQMQKLKGKDASEQFRGQMDTLTAQLSALDSENRAFRAEQTQDTSRRDSLRAQLTTLKDMTKRRTKEIQMMQEDLVSEQAQLENLRKEWAEVDAQEFSEPTVCPTCGQELPEDQAYQIMKDWEDSKTERLAHLTERGKNLSARVEKLQGRISDQSYLLESESETMAKLQEDLDAIPEPKPVEDMPDYHKWRSELEQKVLEVRKLITDAKAPGKKKTADLEAKIEATRQDIDQMTAAIEQEARLHAAEQRIAELQAQAKKAAAELEKLDGMLFLIEEFSRFKAGFVEDSINSLFRHARFRLFRDQINGGLEECCDVLYNGIACGRGLNDSKEINIGIDVIRTISEIKGIHVPLFIDRSESVCDVWSSGGQQILLKVDAGAEKLEVEYQ